MHISFGDEPIRRGRCGLVWDGTGMDLKGWSLMWYTWAPPFSLYLNSELSMCAAIRCIAHPFLSLAICIIRMITTKSEIPSGLLYFVKCRFKLLLYCIWKVCIVLKDYSDELLFLIWLFTHFLLLHCTYDCIFNTCFSNKALTFL